MGAQHTAHPALNVTQPFTVYRVPALNVTQPFTVYRVIGRRPSSVFIDGDMSPTAHESTKKGHRLWDLVYEEHVVEPGDQIQDRGGGIVLVTKEGASHSVQLTPPQPRDLDTAFTHAALTLDADRKRAHGLLKDGFLEIGTVRRVKWTQPISTPKDTFAEDHPLVVPGPH